MWTWVFINALKKYSLTWFWKEKDANHECSYVAQINMIMILVVDNFQKIYYALISVNTHTHTHTHLWYHWFFLALAFYKLSIEFRLNFIDTSMTLLWCLKEFNPNRIPVFTCILIILSIIHIGCGPCNLRGLIQWHLPNETSQHSMSRLHISSPKSLFGFIKTFLEIFIDFSSSSLVTHR